MIQVQQKKMLLLCMFLASFCNVFLCRAQVQTPEQLIIVGGGMAGAIEAFYAYLDAKANNSSLLIKIYEKNDALVDTTICNIVPSLSCDEIIAVVPRGQELVKKLNVLFSNPGGIRVDDVQGINGSAVTEQFKQEAQSYSLDEVGHDQRTQALLALGKMSMDLWLDMYNNADADLKKILELSNFNPCCEPADGETKQLHIGYRIDLMSHVENAQERAESMKRSYEELGYKYCTLLTPEQVIKIDPFLADFCVGNAVNNIWNHDAVALWRPAGCIDARVFLPLLYEYLRKRMGTYTNAQGEQEDRFQIKFGKKVTGVTCATNTDGKLVIEGLQCEDGQTLLHERTSCQYVFCPGEAVGTLKKLGFCEPAYAGFAGVSLLLDIDVPHDKLEEYKVFNHCMEVYQEGVVLAWQARFKNNKIFIGVAGTKAFYSDQQPTKYQEFAKNRNLLQLNMINDVLPEFISLALKYDTKGKTLTEKDLLYLESENIAKRWAGVRAVVYDGFPTLGYLYKDNARVENARCTTHLGSGGGSFAPAATVISRSAMQGHSDPFTQQILLYGNSTRTSQFNLCAETKEAAMAQLRAVQVKNAPKALGPYSQAIKTTDTKGILFISGQLPIVPETGVLVTEPAEATRQCMRNLAAILQEAGMDFSNVVETIILLKNMADFSCVNEAYASFLQEPYPARMTFQAGALPKDAVVEIKMTAVR